MGVGIGVVLTWRCRNPVAVLVVWLYTVNGSWFVGRGFGSEIEYRSNDWFRFSPWYSPLKGRRGSRAGIVGAADSVCLNNGGSSDLVKYSKPSIEWRSG